MSKTISKDLYREFFDKFDLNHDGFISLDEFSQLLNELSKIDKRCSEMFYNMSDKNDDKQLSFEEFYEFTQIHGWFQDFYRNYVNQVVPKTQAQTEQQYDFISDRNSIPFATIILSVTEIAFFMLDYYINKNYISNIDWSCSKTFSYDPKKRTEFWRFLTYMLVHIEWYHLLSNLMVQIFLGMALESNHGWWRVTVVYITGVLAGSLGTSIVTPYVHLTGASAGVYALITAHLATLIMNYKEFMKSYILPITLILIYFALDLGILIYDHYMEPRNNLGNISVHLFGACAGLLVGIGILWNWKELNCEKVVWWCAFLLYCILMISAITWHIINPEYFK